MTYFKNVNTLNELRKQYKELLKKYHPDNPNGSTEATQQINAEYDKLFKLLKNKHESKEPETESKHASDNMKWDFAEDAALREILQKVIHFENIVIELCGSWIWISGNSYQYKDELKEIGFKWASQKKQWFWHGDKEFRKKRNKPLSMDDIRSYYGSTEFRAEERRYLKEA